MFTVEVDNQNPPVETIEVSAIMLGGSAHRLNTTKPVENQSRPRLLELEPLRRHGPLLFGVIGQVLNVLRFRTPAAQRSQVIAQLVGG